MEAPWEAQSLLSACPAQLLAGEEGGLVQFLGL